jgi:hypothetical protein
MMTTTNWQERRKMAPKKGYCGSTECLAEPVNHIVRIHDTLTALEPNTNARDRCMT